MHNPSSCWQISFNQPSETNPYLEEFFEEYFDVMSININDDGTDSLVCYKDIHFDEEDFILQAKQRNIELPQYEKSLLTSQNWLADNVIEFAPVEVADFLIYGIHEKQAPQTEKLAIKIYAATAFGSEHQTTKSCLRAISDLNKQGIKHQNILDMGCGSGILSLACAKLWQNDTHITAVDIDDEAVWVTEQNARDNELLQHLDTECGDGYNAKIVAKNAPFDLIIANILARPLIEMAPNLAKSLKTGGFCILSGFVEDQEDWVINAHLEQGLKLNKIYQLDNWRAAILEKA